MLDFIYFFLAAIFLSDINDQLIHLKTQFMIYVHAFVLREVFFSELNCAY